MSDYEDELLDELDFDDDIDDAEELQQAKHCL